MSFIVVDRSGRKYSCSLDEFKDLPYEELVNLVTGFADYMRNKVQPQLKQGGVR
jgi:hypothetical protein